MLIADQITSKTMYAGPYTVDLSLKRLGEVREFAHSDMLLGIVFNLATFAHSVVLLGPVFELAT